MHSPPSESSARPIRTSLISRLFAGIVLSDGVREAGVRACEALERAAFAAEYEPPEKLHATLAFLGNVGPEKVDDVEQALIETASETAPFEITLDKLGAFPNERRPRILYLGARESNRAFRELSGRLRSRYVDLGFEFHDDAVLHITIARVKGGSLRPLPQIDVHTASMTVREIVLFESMTQARKTRYEILRTAPLGR